MSLNSSEVHEFIGRVRIQATFKNFPSSCQEAHPGLTWLNLTSAKYSQTLTQTSLPDRQILLIIFHVAVIYLIMNFDTTLAVFSWINVYPFSFTIGNRHRSQSLNRHCRSLAFATSFPAIRCQQESKKSRKGSKVLEMGTMSDWSSSWLEPKRSTSIFFKKCEQSTWWN